MKITRNIQLFAAAILATTGTMSLQAQDKPAEEKKPKWESSLTAGVTLTGGNSETLAAAMTAKTVKKWGSNEIKIGADGTYGQSKDDAGDTKVDKNTAHGYAQYNRLFSERFFGYVNADGMFDDIADIYYRVNVSPGLGYYFIKEKATSLSAQVGPGYVWENLAGVKDDYASLRVAEAFSHEFSDRVKVWEKADWTPALENLGKYVVNVEIGLSSYITADKKFAVSLVFSDTYNSRPADDKENNDYRLIAGLTYAF